MHDKLLRKDGFRGLGQADLMLGGDQGDCVVIATEADLLARNIVDDDHVQPLACQFLFGIVDGVGGFGGKANDKRLRLQGGDGTNDVRIFNQLYG